MKKKKLFRQCQCNICETLPRSAKAKEHQAINQVIKLLHEKGRRHFVGLLALQWGRGGLEQLNIITGLSRPTIRRGRAEVQQKERRPDRTRIRQRGAGRKLVEKNSPRF